MTRSFCVGILLLGALSGAPASGETRFIVRTTGGLPLLQTVCTLVGCSVGTNLDGGIGQLYLVNTPQSVDAVAFVASLIKIVGIEDAEADLLASVGSTYTAPPALYEQTPVEYYGTAVPQGYLSQPAAQIVGISQTQSTFGVTGSGVVAIIDTGVDPTHPALQAVLVPGYDFTRNQPYVDEKLDLASIPPPFTAGSDSGWVNQSTAALVDQSTAALVDGNPQFSDFGHGTMVSGIVHLIAPTTLIMPLKAFQADGLGYDSDIIRALYWAQQHGANLINMSFSLAAYSREVANAINLASLQGIICVASAGNSDSDALVYPAGLSDVMGVASTTNDDQRSAFSNYGQSIVWVAAPGEGVVTTYPFNTWAAGWGTSFSTPFVTGTASLMLDGNRSLLNFTANQSTGSWAIGHAQMLTPDLNHGRLDSMQAVSAWRQGVSGVLGAHRE